MPKNVTQYSVLIASPSDVMSERHAVRQTIHDWNTSVGQTLGVSLEPVMWETHATPEMGDRPQSIINRQIVDDCDILVGVFWTRLGSPTGVAMSGTAEEIGVCIEANKPTLIYFSSMPISPIGFDIEQYQKLLGFKSVLEAKGLYGSFGTIEKLRADLHDDLTRTINRVQKATATSPGEPNQKVFESEIPDMEEAKHESGPNRVPFEALSKKDRDFWRTKAIKKFIEEGVTSAGPNAINNMAQALYRESTRTTEDLLHEFLAGQRAAMRQERVSEAAKKAASRLPQEGDK